jgi:hypothetical protein
MYPTSMLTMNLERVMSSAFLSDLRLPRKHRSIAVRRPSTMRRSCCFTFPIPPRCGAIMSEVPPPHEPNSAELAERGVTCIGADRTAPAWLARNRCQNNQTSSLTTLLV